MPTPFMHLAAAVSLFDDPALDASHRAAINAHPGAFLLGNIAPDARYTGGVSRAATHFHRCNGALWSRAWVQMLHRYPALRHNKQNTARSSFVAGYIAHLAMDITFCQRISYPYMLCHDDLQKRMGAHWRQQVLLIWLDARAYAVLPAEMGHTLATTTPQDWLPFLPDDTLADWRDLIAGQMPPDGHSQTLDLMATRASSDPAWIADIITDPAQMANRIWAHIPRDVVEQTETEMVSHAQQAIARFFEDDI